MDDYEEESDIVCPVCDACPVHRRECTSCSGEGYDRTLYEEDPLWYEPGDAEECEECHGLGYELWCPVCGADMTMADMRVDVEAQYMALEYWHYRGPE